MREDAAFVEFPSVICVSLLDSFVSAIVPPLLRSLKRDPRSRDIPNANKFTAMIDHASDVSRLIRSDGSAPFPTLDQKVDMLDRSLGVICSNRIERRASS